MEALIWWLVGVGMCLVLGVVILSMCDIAKRADEQAEIDFSQLREALRHKRSDE